MPITPEAGNRPCNNCNCFATNLLARKLTPLTLPPGRFMLTTRPNFTGSAPIANTMGMLEVAALAASAAAVAPPEPVLLPPVPELEPTTLPVSAAPAAALQVASRWARAWLRPPDGTTAARWLDGLRSTTTDEYLGVLAGVDPANIPATKVTGAAEAVSVAPRSLRVQVPTDALTLVITVVDTDTGWRVSGYDRE